MATSISEQPFRGDLRATITERAAIEGFDVVGFTTPDAIAHSGEKLHRFLELGRHGDMEWMARNVERRASPAALWPDAQTVVVVARSYAPDHDPLDDLAKTDHGVVSVYARRRDYHDVLKGALKRLGQWTGAKLGAELKVFVDTAPLMEKPLAGAAGIGWQGKHTNLVSREFGSWLFLGVMLTTLRIEPDEPGGDHCGSCQACLDICPTKAFPAPYQLDARRCISYLTIEHGGHIAPEFRAAIGNRIFGCDDCLAACPWNKFAGEAHTNIRQGALALRDELAPMALADLAALDDAAFRVLFSRTAIKRTGRDRFVRNVMIALGNCNDRALLPAVEARLGDSSELVRAMAVWALARLAWREEVSAASLQYLPGETDEAVRAEWHAAVTGEGV